MNQPSVSDNTMTSYGRATTGDKIATDPDALVAETLADMQREAHGAFGSPVCSGADPNGLPTLPLLTGITPEKVSSVVAELEQGWTGNADETAPIAPGGPEAMIANLPNLDDDNLVAFGTEIDAVIADARRKHEAELAPHLQIIAAVKNEIEHRVVRNFESLEDTTSKSTYALAVPGYEAGVEVKREQAKFIDVLRRLEDKVTPEEFEAAVYQTPPPEPKDLPWKADLRKLAALKKKYGEKSEIGKIVNEGTEFREVSRCVFLRVIEQAQKNVTDAVSTGDAA